MVHDFETVQAPGDAFLQQVAELKSSKFSFFLSEKNWREVDDFNLGWSEVRFSSENKNNVPNQRGVYAFIVRHQNGFFPPGHGYIFYIGETSRGLQTRYKEYLYEQKKLKKRPKVFNMLNSFKNDLVFAYSVVADAQIATKDIEKKLCRAILPPVVLNDIPAEIRPAYMAAWS